MLHRTLSAPALCSNTGRVRPAQFRRARRVAGAATAIAAAAATLVGLAGQGSSSAVSSAAGVTARYGPVTISDTNYPIPTGALFVANDGSDTSPGTLAAPLRTIKKALAAAPTGGTIVVRGGTYRESFGPIKRKVTIQAYPHEAPMVKGSVVATSFTAGTNGYSTPFSTPMCTSCYTAAALRPGFPAAGLPEQVFVDGQPLDQVTNEAALVPGSFWVNRANGVIWLADDPTGHTVEVTVLGTAFSVSPAAIGTTVRGLGFAHWATVYAAGNGSPNVAIMSTASNVTLADNTFAWSATRALGIYGSNTVVTNNKFLNNGMNGLLVHKVGGLDFENNEVAYSNYERWDITPSAFAQTAGAKLTSVVNTVARGNYFHDNDSNGLWFDVLSKGQTIIDNTIEHNGGHGLAVEVSANSIIAGNTIAKNGRDGLKVAGANNVEIWNNTIVDNGWAQFGLYDDARHTPAPITSDTTNVRIANNIFQAGPSSMTSKYVLTNMDVANPKTATFAHMVSANDHNNYGRSSTVGWKFGYQIQLTLTKYGRFQTLAELSAATGRERASTSSDNVALEALFVDPANGNYTPLASVLPQLSAPASLPTAVAAALGTSTTPDHIGAT